MTDLSMVIVSAGACDKGCHIPEPTGVHVKVDGVTATYFLPAVFDSAFFYQHVRAFGITCGLCGGTARLAIDPYVEPIIIPETQNGSEEPVCDPEDTSEVGARRPDADTKRVQHLV